MLSKKGDSLTFVAFTILIILLVVFLLLTKLKTTETVIEKTGSVQRDYQGDFLSVSAVTAPYITIRGVSLEELMGVYSCYNNDTIDYGAGLEWDFISELRKKFNQIYGRDHWILQIYVETYAEIPEMVFISDHSRSMSDDNYIISQVKNIISPESDLRYISEFYNIDEIKDCKYYGDGVQYEENWGGAAIYICDNGPPPNFDGNWPDNVPKVIFLSSDEASCGGVPCTYDPTPTFVDKAIDACQNAGVKVYFLMPNNRPSTCDPFGFIYPLPVDQVERLTNATGGRIIDITNAQEVAQEIMKDLDLKEGGVSQITSKEVFLNFTNPPANVEYTSYNYVFPLPCSENFVGTATLIYSQSEKIVEPTSCHRQSDCEDHDPCTQEKCNLADEICIYGDIAACVTGDDCCPASCSTTNDGDCCPVGTKWDGTTCVNICEGPCDKGIECEAGCSSCSVSDCCGNGVCDTKTGEDCRTCKPDCPGTNACCPGCAGADGWGYCGEDEIACGGKCKLPPDQLGSEEVPCDCDAECESDLSCTANHCCPKGTRWDGTSCADTFDVLVVGLRGLLEEHYNDQQLDELEESIDDYLDALGQDGLGGIFLYLDENETSDLIGSKVTHPEQWNQVDAIIEQLIPALQSKYLLLVGGAASFPQADTTAAAETDDVYGDYEPKDGRLDIPVGRVLDPNQGDISLLKRQFANFAKLHREGGIDLQEHTQDIFASNYLTGECFSQYIWKVECSSYPDCHINQPGTVASGKNFFHLTEHGGAFNPQTYGGTLRSTDLGNYDVTDSLWMMVPCYGGLISNKNKKEDSVPMMFLNGGGAVFLGSTDLNYGAITGSSCSETIDGAIGLLYYLVAKKMVQGSRFGDSYLQGKNEFLAMTSYSYQAQINHIYGDPSLKIKEMWSS